MTLELSIHDGSGRQIELRAGSSTRVGRTSRADVVVASDPRMSGLHFVVENWRGTFRVRDCRSSNGTFVNGTRVEEFELQVGDVIMAGQTEFVVRDALTPSTAQRGPARPADARQLAAQQSSAVPGATQVNAVEGKRAGSDEGDADDDDLPNSLLALDNQTPFTVATVLWEDAQGAAHLSVIVKATLTLGNPPRIAAQQLAILAADQPEAGEVDVLRLESDLVPFKPATDIVLVGKAHAAHRRPVAQMDVRVAVGGTALTIRVFGDRRWIFPTRAQLVPVIAQPQLFTEMDLTYRRSFGGIDEHAALYCRENLSGVGFVGALTPKSIHGTPLPNLEDPRHLIDRWDARPHPVGFGFYGRGWWPRLPLAGTFDESYHQTRTPRAPLRASAQFYNGAHPELQVAGYLRGNESVELVGVTAESPFRCELPGLRPMIRISRKAPHATRRQGATPLAGDLATGWELPPVRPELDTLVFLAEERLFYQVYRAVFPLASLDDIDIGRIQISTS